MAKKRREKGVEDHIAELEAVVGVIAACPACGSSIEASAVTCPFCGAPVHEAEELQAKAAESLEDLEKQLEETTGEPTRPEPPAPPPEETRNDEGLASAAALAEDVEEPEASEASVPPAPESEAAFEPEPPAEPVESPDLEGFIAQIEEEVGVEAPAAAKAAPAAKSTARAVRRSPPAPPKRPGRWKAPAVAAGVVLYLLSLFLTALLGKLLVASVMIAGTVLVFAGINGGLGSSGRAPKASPQTKAISDYVCPLCGTEISANATQCPTCGAVFED